MRKQLLLLGISSLLATTTLHAQEFQLHPLPQAYITQDDSINIPQQYQVLSGNSLHGGATLTLLHSLMPGEVSNATFSLYIGIKGSQIIPISPIAV